METEVWSKATWCLPPRKAFKGRFSLRAAWRRWLVVESTGILRRIKKSSSWLVSCRGLISGIKPAAMQSLDGENLIWIEFTPAGWTGIYRSRVFWHMVLPSAGFDQSVIYIFLCWDLCLFTIFWLADLLLCKCTTHAGQNPGCDLLPQRVLYCVCLLSRATKLRVPEIKKNKKKNIEHTFYWCAII